MLIILLVLLLAIILGGLGFAIHSLWWIALACRVWLPGFIVRAGNLAPPPPLVPGVTGSRSRAPASRLLRRPGCRVLAGGAAPGPNSVPLASPIAASVPGPGTAWPPGRRPPRCSTRA